MALGNQMAKTMSMGVTGVSGFPVDVEVFCAGGIPGMEIIGLPEPLCGKAGIG